MLVPHRVLLIHFLIPYVQMARICLYMLRVSKRLLKVSSLDVYSLVATVLTNLVLVY